MQSSAALHGKVEVLRWMFSHGFECDIEAWNSAARAGNVEVLAYLWRYEGEPDSNAEDVVHAAVSCGHLHVLQVHTGGGCSYQPRPGTRLICHALDGWGCGYPFPRPRVERQSSLAPPSTTQYLHAIGWTTWPMMDGMSSLLRLVSYQDCGTDVLDWLYEHELLPPLEVMLQVIDVVQFTFSNTPQLRAWIQRRMAGG
jgi:hypothetical protein